MPQHQLVGVVIMAIAVVDGFIGHLVVLPRVKDEAKRQMLKVMLSASSVLIAAGGFAVYSGLLHL